MFTVIAIIAAGLIIWDLSMHSAPKRHSSSGRRGNPDSVFDEDYVDTKYSGRDW